MTRFRLLAITCAVSLGGLLFGFDSGVISGCEEAIQREFALSPFWHGLVVAGALIGTVFGALAAGRMCDRFGRKPTLVWMGVLFFVSAAGCALTPGGETLGPQVLGWMRFVGGIAIGGVSVAVPMYIAEIAPPESRGRLVLVNQFCIVLGIVVSYVSNYCVAKWLPFSPAVVWRTMLGAECLPALLYLGALAYVPESPHQKSVVAAAPLFVRRNLKPIILCFTVAFFSQLSGVNAVNYYAPRIFRMSISFSPCSHFSSSTGSDAVRCSYRDVRRWPRCTDSSHGRFRWATHVRRGSQWWVCTDSSLRWRFRRAR